MNKPFKIYAENPDSLTLEQFESAMACDTVVQGALMPDAHVGYGLPIGAVVATKDTVYPAWVGFDIGCGVLAHPLPSVGVEQIRSYAKTIFDAIYRDVPVGMKINEEGAKYPDYGLSDQGRTIAHEKSYQRALGSLGSGNHFIEIGRDESGQIWVIIHSGSRGVGHGLATYYMRKANPDKAPGHHGLDVNSEAGQNYIQDMNWALDFAPANRLEMLRRVFKCIEGETDSSPVQIDKDQLINRNHNHALQGTNGLWIHRKGATHAEDGMLGVIPGTMFHGSFIVRGRGCPDSLCSSSHGAGRAMSRKKAKAEISMKDFRDQMKGVQARVNRGTLDEAPPAYKDIRDVMRLQENLVEILHHVTPMINVKG